MIQPQTERLGVSALDYFFAESGWLFRKQTTHDFGIDAHVIDDFLADPSAPEIIGFTLK